MNPRLVSAAIVLVLSGILLGGGRLRICRASAEFAGCSDFIGTCPRILSPNEPQECFSEWYRPRHNFSSWLRLVGNWKSQATR